MIYPSLRHKGLHVQRDRILVPSDVYTECSHLSLPLNNLSNAVGKHLTEYCYTVVCLFCSIWLLQKMTHRLMTPVLALHTKSLEKERLMERFLLLTIKCLPGHPNERTYSILNPYIVEMGTAVARG